MTKRPFNMLAIRSAQAAVPPMGQMAPPAPMPDNPAAGVQPALGGTDAPQQFTLSSLIDFIDQNPADAMGMLRSKLPDQQVDVNGQPAEALSLLEPENWRTADDQKKGQIAGLIMQALPPEMKAEQEMKQDDTTVPAIPAKIEAAVKASNEAVRKLASQYAASFTKSLANKTAVTGRFNRLKVAHQTAVDTVLFGPNTTRVFPSVNQVGNDWHVTERNKGWGLKVDEFYGIDYEMVWRQNVMDKYHREYRDKDGNWVGGYIQKRFEVDKNIPEINNMQLKPGQTRKPYLPQFGSTEARLEQQRVDNKVPGAKVFNWTKQASVQAAQKKK